MGNDQSKTERDEGPARRSARKVWVESTLTEYLKACACFRRDPEAGLVRVRKVLEGWAHATAVDRNPNFTPYDGADLHRGQLVDLFTFAVRQLPRALQGPMTNAKRLADEAAHNQGEEGAASASQVRLVLISCGELVEWTFEQIARTPAPASFYEAVRLLEGAAATPLPTVEATPLPAAFDASPIPMPTATWTPAPLTLTEEPPWVNLPPAPFTPTEEHPWVNLPPPPARPRAPSRLPGTHVRLAAAAGLLVVCSGFFLSRPSAEERVLARVEAYGQVLSSRNLDEIARFHGITTRRFYIQHNYSRNQVRDAYGDWFKGHPSVQKIEFKNCQVLPPSGNGEQAVRCGAFSGTADKPIGTCLVFDDAGLVVSRTEFVNVPQCPPP